VEAWSKTYFGGTTQEHRQWYRLYHWADC